jgi:hypothetical protein
MPDNPRDMTPDHTVTEVATRYGMLRVPDVAACEVGHALATFGEWAQYEIRFAAGNLSDSARIADVCAFIGTFGMGLAQLIRPDSLCFVEPDAGASALLRDNVARNTATPAVVVDTLRAAHGPYDLIRFGAEPNDRDMHQYQAWLGTSAGALLLPCDESIDSLDRAAALLAAGPSVTYFAFPTFAPDNFNGANGAAEPITYASRLWVARDARPRLDAGLADSGCFIAPIASREDLRAAFWRTPRWAPAHWRAATAREIIAAAARDLLGDDEVTFLSHRVGESYRHDPPPPKRMTLDLRLARAHKTIRSLEALLHHDRARLIEQEQRIDGLLMADASTRARLHTAEVATQRTEAELAETRAALAAIHASTGWRMMVAVTATADRHPALKPVLRALACAARGLRRAVS